MKWVFQNFLAMTVMTLVLSGCFNSDNGVSSPPDHGFWEGSFPGPENPEINYNIPEGTVHLKWDPSPREDIKEYRIIIKNNRSGDEYEGDIYTDSSEAIDTVVPPRFFHKTDTIPYLRKYFVRAITESGEVSTVTSFREELKIDPRIYIKPEFEWDNINIFDGNSIHGVPATFQVKVKHSVHTFGKLRWYVTGKNDPVKVDALSRGNNTASLRYKWENPGERWVIVEAITNNGQTFRDTSSVVFHKEKNECPCVGLNPERILNYSFPSKQIEVLNEESAEVVTLHNIPFRIRFWVQLQPLGIDRPERVMTELTTNKIPDLDDGWQAMPWIQSEARQTPLMIEWKEYIQTHNQMPEAKRQWQSKHGFKPTGSFKFVNNRSKVRFEYNGDQIERWEDQIYPLWHYYSSKYGEGVNPGNELLEIPFFPSNTGRGEQKMAMIEIEYKMPDGTTFNTFSYKVYAFLSGSPQVNIRNKDYQVGSTVIKEFNSGYLRDTLRVIVSLPNEEEDLIKAMAYRYKVPDDFPGLATLLEKPKIERGNENVDKIDSMYYELLINLSNAKPSVPERLPLTSSRDEEKLTASIGYELTLDFSKWENGYWIVWIGTMNSKYVSGPIIQGVPGPAQYRDVYSDSYVNFNPFLIHVEKSLDGAMAKVSVR